MRVNGSQPHHALVDPGGYDADVSDSEKELIHLFDLHLKLRRCDSPEDKFLAIQSHVLEVDPTDVLETTDIELSGYGLEMIPRNLNQFSHLEKLSLSGNKLAFERFEMPHLLSLRVLKLDDCDLSYIPPDFLRLFPNLQELDLSRNQLEIGGILFGQEVVNYDFVEIGGCRVIIKGNHITLFDEPIR
ncbi:MAG: hypothetical protein S4CHLAM37_08400 [Chlamydiia bacterium]|nr:hypothetical protein [Chlamydiia bacterium]